MNITGKKIGFGLTGSFCTLEKALTQMELRNISGAELWLQQERIA